MRRRERERERKRREKKKEKRDSVGRPGMAPKRWGAECPGMGCCGVRDALAQT